MCIICREFQIGRMNIREVRAALTELINNDTGIDRLHPAQMHEMDDKDLTNTLNNTEVEDEDEW